MINTMSKFYYGHTISDTNQYLDFKEDGGPELTAVVDIGEYSLTDFVNKISAALNNAGDLEYSVSVDRSTRLITVAATGGNVQLLASSGTNASRSCYGLLGFSSDTSSSSSHIGTLSSGYEWKPQFLVQDYVSFNDQQMAIDGVTRQSTSGKVEAVKFGNKKIMDANFRFITDIYQSSKSPIENDESGYLNSRSFLEYAITKADLEFIPDRNDPDVFHKCILESTPESSDGLGFKLKELYSQGLVGYYETGVLKFREI